MVCLLSSVRKYGMYATTASYSSISQLPSQPVSLCKNFSLLLKLFGLSWLSDRIFQSWNLDFNTASQANVFHKISTFNLFITFIIPFYNIFKNRHHQQTIILMKSVQFYKATQYWTLLLLNLKKSQTVPKIIHITIINVIIMQQFIQHFFLPAIYI